MSSAETGRRSPNNWEPVIQELTKGREFAGELKALLQKEESENREQDSVTGELIREVMATFSRALAALDARDGENEKIRSGRRGGYRRRRSHPYSCISTTSKTLDDGHSWRKYGQKAIYNAKFSRSYFRCTHKYDQGCAATRQVQQSEEDPSLFVITYFGEHTCRRDPAEVSSSCIKLDACIIDAASMAKAECFQRPRFSSLLKQVCSEEVASNHPTSGSSSSGYFGAPELGTLEGSAQFVAEIGRGSEQGDVDSGLMQFTTGDLSWDFMEFSDFLSFGDDELLRGY